MARFRMEDIQVPLPTLFESTWATTRGLRYQCPRTDCRRPHRVDLAEQVSSFTGVGSRILPTSLQISIATVIILIIGKVAVPKCHSLFRTFLPQATQCLHCPPDEILSTPERDHVIDVFPSSCSGVDLGYLAKSRAML